jgi:broad specificity phosphatase PhoE
MTTLYLIRHSVKYPKKEIESSYCNDDKDLYDEKMILSVEGEKRAELLSHEKELQNIDVVYTSNMVRSIATAKYLCEDQKLKYNIDMRLNERRYGKQNSNDFEDWYERQYLYSDFRTIGGESQEDVRNRMFECVTEILEKNKGKRIAVFSHGYAITFLLLRWCELVDVTRERKLTYKYKNKIIFDKIINAPEVFKLEFDDNNELLDIKLIEFDDLPYRHGGI